LRERGLAQTCNFVDGFGWDKSLFGEGSCDQNFVAFPYWEAWSLPAQEDRFFEEVVPRGGGVFVCYPGKSAKHTDEGWNHNAAGVWPLDLLIKRWRKARCHGSTYLAIGDGSRHIQTEYFPDSAWINPKDVKKITQEVFNGCAFRWECRMQPRPSPPQRVPVLRVVPARQRPQRLHAQVPAWLGMACGLALGAAALSLGQSLLACHRTEAGPGKRGGDAELLL